jgi:hypothetical protein
MEQYKRKFSEVTGIINEIVPIISKYIKKGVKEKELAHEIAIALENGFFADSDNKNENDPRDKHFFLSFRDELITSLKHIK